MELIIALKIPLIILQAVLAPLLILFILLQAGKGDDLNSALGGMGGNQVQGTGGASTFLLKGTTFLAIFFMLNSIVLAKVFKEESARSIGTGVAEPLAPATGAPAESGATPTESTPTTTPPASTPAPTEGHKP